MDDPICDATTFSKNRERLLAGDIADAFFAAVLQQSRQRDTLSDAYGRAERDAALLMAEQLPGRHRVTLAADKGYDTREFVGELRGMWITPHVARNSAHRLSAVDRRTTRRPGYGLSQKKRKRIEEVFGWMKTVGLLRKLRHRGLERVSWMFTFTAAA
jgi:hypothetical protein